jgi:hypothetical protein
LLTTKDTLVKAKKHRGMQRVWGASITVDLSSKRAAFALLRSHRPKGVLVPLDECDCAYEVPVISGIDPQLTPESGIGAPLEGERARQFVHDAHLVLSGLHRLGIRHGDPGYHNFLITKAGLWLIDLDDVDGGSKAWARWELMAFLRDTAVPLLGRKGTVGIVLRHRFGRAYFLAISAGAVYHFLRRGRSATRTLVKIALFYLRQNRLNKCKAK